jgi:hypothetical protein
MGNYVIEVGNYVIVSPSQLGNYKIADSWTWLRIARVIGRSWNGPDGWSSALRWRWLS